MDYLERYRDLIYNITAADVQRASAQYIRPDLCTVVVAGPDLVE
ncbi:MAG: hypothetical protein R2867_24505 [Caldilineaceae bacterium]